MLFEHKVLRPHKEAMLKFINSGSEFEMRKALNDNAVVIIQKLREHMIDEDKILYRITLQLFTNEELKEIMSSIN